MGLWFFHKVVWFVLASVLEGMLLPSKMAAKTTFWLYLVQRLIVTLRCAVNVITSSFQHFPRRLSAKFVFRERYFTENSYKTAIISYWRESDYKTFFSLTGVTGSKQRERLISWKDWWLQKSRELQESKVNENIHKKTLFMKYKFSSATVRVRPAT